MRPEPQQRHGLEAEEVEGEDVERLAADVVHRRHHLAVTQQPCQLLPHAHARRVEVAVAQQHATDEEEAGHPKELDEMVDRLWESGMASHHQDDTNGLGHVERQVAWLLRVLCHVLSLVCRAFSPVVVLETAKVYRWLIILHLTCREASIVD